MSGPQAEGAPQTGPASPTLPLPPPRATQISLEDFIETAARAALRALEAHAGEQAQLSPQPLPPREGAVALRATNGHIIIGIIAAPQALSE